jgi:hypothetical protein
LAQFETEALINVLWGKYSLILDEKIIADSKS